MKLSYSEIKMVIVMIRNWGFQSTVNLLERLGSSSAINDKELRLCENSLLFIDKYETKLQRRYP